MRNTNGYGSNTNSGQIRRIVKLEQSDQKVEIKPEVKPKEPIKPTPIQLRLNQDHRDQTNLLNIDGKSLLFGHVLFYI